MSFDPRIGSAKGDSDPTAPPSSFPHQPAYPPAPQLGQPPLFGPSSGASYPQPSYSSPSQPTVSAASGVPDVAPVYYQQQQQPQHQPPLYGMPGASSSSSPPVVMASFVQPQAVLQQQQQPLQGFSLLEDARAAVVEFRGQRRRLNITPDEFRLLAPFVGKKKVESSLGTLAGSETVKNLFQRPKCCIKWFPFAVIYLFFIGCATGGVVHAALTIPGGWTAPVIGIGGSVVMWCFVSLFLGPVILQVSRESTELVRVGEDGARACVCDGKMVWFPLVWVVLVVFVLILFAFFTAVVALAPVLNLIMAVFWILSFMWLPYVIFGVLPAKMLHSEDGELGEKILKDDRLQTKTNADFGAMVVGLWMAIIPVLNFVLYPFYCAAVAARVKVYVHTLETLNAMKRRIVKQTGRRGGIS